MYWDDEREVSDEVAKKVSDYQKQRWAKIRRREEENSKKSPP